ncbi:hypothetical protein CFOL_v3_00803, partial [Cephalotus follicularis]
ASYHGIPSGLAIMNVETMNNHICHELDGDACTVSNMDIRPTTINGLKAVHNELLLQLYDHVPFEDNPERVVLDHSMAQSSRLGVNGVIICRIRDNIEAPVPATNGISAKTNAAVCKTLAVAVPAGVTAPAVVNGIASST